MKRSFWSRAMGSMPNHCLLRESSVTCNKRLGLNARFYITLLTLYATKSKDKSWACRSYHDLPWRTLVKFNALHRPVPTLNGQASMMVGFAFLLRSWTVCVLVHSG